MRDGSPDRLFIGGCPEQMHAGLDVEACVVIVLEF